MVSLVLSTLGDTSSLGSPPHQVVYPPGFMVPPLGIASHFLVENSEFELKPTTSLPSYFSMFSSSTDP